MPVQIGITSPSFSDPTGLLSDCHRRVEMFLGVLLTISETAEFKLTTETRTALDKALR
jgi:hypothetical protein